MRAGSCGDGSGPPIVWQCSGERGTTAGTVTGFVAGQFLTAFAAMMTLGFDDEFADQC